MSTLPQWFVQQWDTAVRKEAAQTDSRLMSAVTDRGTIAGESFTINFMGDDGSLLDANNVRHGDTTWSEAEHEARVVTMADFYKAYPLDRNDIPKMLVNPVTGGDYMRLLMAAKNRKIDDVIYDAIRGTITSKDGATSYALPSGQKIAHGSAGMTLSKILQAHRMLNAAEVPMDGRFFWIDSFALEDMLNIQQLTSSDYNSVKMLTTGEVNSFMGFSWSMYNYAAESAVYYAVAGHRSALGLAIPKELSTQVDKRPDRSNIWQVYVSADFGSVRIVDEGIIEVAYQ